jgi:hypothetical protein
VHLIFLYSLSSERLVDIKNHKILRRESSTMAANRLRNSPFMTAVEAVNTSKYNGKEQSIFGKHMGMDFSR